MSVLIEIGKIRKEYNQRLVNITHSHHKRALRYTYNEITVDLIVHDGKIFTVDLPPTYLDNIEQFKELFRKN